MPNIASVLKEEITRLARKESKSFTKSLARASAQFRRDIAELKRQNAKAKAEIALLARRLAKSSTAPAPAADTGKVRFTVKTVAALRKRLGLSAENFGKLVGVSAQAVYTWEHGISKPRRQQIVVIANLRGLGRREAQKRLEQTGQKAARQSKKKA